MGIVSPAGSTVESAWSNVLNGRSGIGLITSFDTTAYPTRFAGLGRDFSAEVFSRLLDWNDRRTCVLFGDGAEAVVIQQSDTPGILSSHLHADGSLAHILRVDGGISQGQIRGNPFLEMDGAAVFKLAVRVLDECATEALTHNKLKADQIDWFIPHQANLRIINAIANKIGLPPERVVTTVARHGNTSAASVPLALDTAVRDGRLKPGQVIMLQGVGGGMTWGTVLLRW